jgi:hypothetical protein
VPCCISAAQEVVSLQRCDREEFHAVLHHQGLAIAAILDGKHAVAGPAAWKPLLHGLGQQIPDAELEYLATHVCKGGWPPAVASFVLPGNRHESVDDLARDGGEGVGASAVGGPDHDVCRTTHGKQTDEVASELPGAGPAVWGSAWRCDRKVARFVIRK